MSLVSYKHGRHVKVTCLLKIGQIVTLDKEYGMAKINGRRQVAGGKRFKILAIHKSVCESSFMVILTKDLIVDSNWVSV